MPDPRLQKMLTALIQEAPKNGIEASFEDLGDWVKITAQGDSRSQVIVVQAVPERIGPHGKPHYEAFAAYSPICDVSQLEALDERVAYVLLESTYKIGHVRIADGTVALAHDVYADATPAAFTAVILNLAHSADQLEEMLTNGADDY